MGFIFTHSRVLRHLNVFLNKVFSYLLVAASAYLCGSFPQLATIRRVNLPDEAQRYSHVYLCSCRPEIKHNKALIQSVKQFNSSVCQSQKECFLQQLRDGSKCSTWRDGSILKYGTAAALTAHPLPPMSAAEAEKVKTSTAWWSATWQPDNRLCHFQNVDKWHIFRSHSSTSFPSGGLQLHQKGFALRSLQMACFR